MKFGVFDHMDDAGVPHEEPYMSDQMSDGRLEPDVGRGVSPSDEPTFVRRRHCPHGPRHELGSHSVQIVLHPVIQNVYCENT